MKGNGRQGGSSAAVQRGGSHHHRDQRAKAKLIRGLITLTVDKNEAR